MTSKFDEIVAKIVKEANNPTYTGQGGFQTDASNKGGQPTAAQPANTVAAQRQQATKSDQQQNNGEQADTPQQGNKNQEMLKQFLTDPDFVNRLKTAFNDPNKKIETPEDILGLFK